MSHRFLAVALGLSAIVASTPGMAAVPKIRGDYVVRQSEECGSSGSYYTGNASFDRSGGYVLLAYQSDGYNLFGFSVSGPYSNTKDTVTVRSIVYHATYGTVSGTNVLEFFELIRAEGNGCTEQLSYQKIS